MVFLVPSNQVFLWFYDFAFCMTKEDSKWIEIGHSQIPFIVFTISEYGFRLLLYLEVIPWKQQVRQTAKAQKAKENYLHQGKLE